MHHKMNPTRLLRNLNTAHDEITSALSYLGRIVLATDPGAARVGLHDMQVQFEQIFAQTLSLKRRIRIWATTFPELTDAAPADTDAFLSDFFGFEAEAEDGEDADDEHADFDGEADEDDEDEFVDDDKSDENDDDTAALQDTQDHAATSAKAIDQSGFALSDDDLGRLFGISAASATAGVRETGYVDIFGAWQEGRRPGPYKGPSTPKADEGPDYNTPGEAV